MSQTKFKCSKCGCEQFEQDRIRTTGDGFSRFFDVQNKKFTAITCKECRLTEFYKGDTSTLGHILDFMVGH